ncbi:hypothetical protein NM688_g8149 [Phlebia brevispora]|uniref:Uncharacterized protein n=1 Tax=Phlebia brevispora TaxID=194682 RepID=A0ACC1RWM2_9APHY|nr:hypothetical protein NM688_g8149 [Phlebia brevispora]
MMLTALECRSRGITFASVHDSYWTHACSVTEMSGIIRDTFIALHSSDVLSRLDEEFRERYKGYKIPMAALRVKQLWAKLGLSAEGIKLDKLSRVFPRLLSLANMEGTPSQRFEAATAILHEEDALVDPDAPVTRRRGRPRKRMIPKSEQPAEEREEQEEQEEKEEEEDSEGTEYDGKFVDLVDILPAVPKKGMFDVNTIKQSVYFFS